MSSSSSSRPSEGSDARQPGLGAFLRRKGIGVKERGDESDVKLTEMTVQQQEEEARKENREVLRRGSLLSQMDALTSVIQPGIRGAVKDTWVQQPRVMPKGVCCDKHERQVAVVPNGEEIEGGSKGPLADAAVGGAQEDQEKRVPVRLLGHNSPGQAVEERSLSRSRLRS
ncbi:hypothetical protein FOZ62_022099 [Perkinsus olseni]|uniref:Uncharacterized protein n=1 Tax=Perkinsus olseni TaxID=32597 RepID=A0A7J6Q3I0_PEROL|nr:hypothetical protein FOZ62_022099 [Perkinsus olseni]